MENPNNPLNDTAYDLFGGPSSIAGMKVSHQTAMRIPAFWQGVTKISGDVAKIRLEIYKKSGDDDREKAKSHPAYHIVRFQPNPEQTARQFFRQAMVNALVWSNSYAVIQRNGRGDVTGLFPLLPDRTTPVRIDGRKVYETQINRTVKYYDAFDIWHLKGISFDGDCGLDMVRYMRNSIGKILARENFASRFYRSGGRVGGILQLPWTTDKTKRDKVEVGFRQSYEKPDAAFKTIILRENAKFHAAQGTFRDSQMHESEKEDVRTVARMLNIPPNMLGDDSASSYNSLEAERQAYNANTLSHWFCEIEDECWLKFFSAQTKASQKFFFEHTIGALLWADSKTVSEIGSRGVLAGWLKPNEPRHWFNLPTDPNGDSLLVPSGMVAGDVAVDDEPEPMIDAPIDTSETKSQIRTALDGLIEQTTARFFERLKRQEQKHKRNNTDWPINDNMAIGREMFSQAQRIETELFGATRDYALEIIQTFGEYNGTSHDD